MKRSTRKVPRQLLAGAVALLALPLLGLPAGAEVVATVPAAPSSSPLTADALTSEDLARSGEPYSVYLWIAAPIAVAALWFLFSRLWASPQSADHR